VLCGGHHSPIQGLSRALRWRFSHRSDQSPLRGQSPHIHMQPVTCLLQRSSSGAYRRPSGTFIPSPFSKPVCVPNRHRRRAAAAEFPFWLLVIDSVSSSVGRRSLSSLLLGFLQPPWQTGLVFLGQFPLFHGCSGWRCAYQGDHFSRCSAYCLRCIDQNIVFGVWLVCHRLTVHGLMRVVKTRSRPSFVCNPP